MNTGIGVINDTIVKLRGCGKHYQLFMEYPFSPFTLLTNPNLFLTGNMPNLDSFAARSTHMTRF